MSDTRSELKKLVPLYCDELNSLDLSLYENYEFSKDYLNKKEKLIKMKCSPFVRQCGIIEIYQ